MPRPALPEPDPGTLVVRLADGTLVLLADTDPALVEAHSPLRRALRTFRHRESADRRGD
ncbi:hypothetical protein [Streptomyces sp. NPDC008121]|uniref:hypothetical protein n=1 Tax=Streptomyces sp. NPDC008121 TaxID=3364809 RepID=UPI0036E1F0E0